MFVLEIVKLLSELRSQQILATSITSIRWNFLDFLDKGGHGITLDKYSNHFILAFDLTSTQEASHDFIQNLNFSIWVQFAFDGALAANVEYLFLGERSSTFDKKLNYHLPHRCIVMKYAICWENVVI